MLFWGQKKKVPKSQEAQMAEALSAMKKDQSKKSKRRARRYAKWLPSWVDSRILIAILILAIAIIGDGVRRENQEFYAATTYVNGMVQVYARGTSGAQALAEGDKLEDQSVVETGANGSVVFAFPDGSVVSVGPSSSMTIKLLEYNRGGQWRTRAFYLRFGQLWARVGPYFGQESEMKVYTPSSIAAVRGTTFSVYQEPKGQSDVMCVQGTVEAQGFTGAPQLVGPNGTSTTRQGDQAGSSGTLDARAAASFRQAPLSAEIAPPSWIKTTELAITQILDAPLQILGIGKASWGVGAYNYTRRAAVQEQLRRIHVLIEGSATYPDYVNPATLEELNLPANETQKMLSVFNGEGIELYRQLQGGRDFIMFARAKDPSRSLYKLTSYGVGKGTEEELRQYRAM